MHFVIFGLTVSSSWGNGHATLWRGLLKAMSRRGHTVVFHERDVPYYANARDGWMAPEGITVRIFSSLDAVRNQVDSDLEDADVALVTSYCPDGPAASRVIFNSRVPIRAFYDLDTPTTLDALCSGTQVAFGAGLSCSEPRLTPSCFHNSADASVTNRWISEGPLTMPDGFLDFDTFPHRKNEDGTIDSICPHCFMTIATSTHEADLSQTEAAHKCKPDLCRRSNPSSNSREETEDDDSVHHIGETHKSIH